MIQKGQLTVIDMETYTCVDVKDGYAYLKNVSSRTRQTKKDASTSCSILYRRW